MVIFSNIIAKIFVLMLVDIARRRTNMISTISFEITSVAASTDSDNYCYDNYDWVDSAGYTCKDWEHYDCNEAATIFDGVYTGEDVKDIKTNCRLACG